MIKEIEINGEKYLCCKDILCDYIGVSVGKYRGNTRKFKTNTMLLGNVITANVKTKGGNQDCFFIRKECVYLWFCSMNLSLFTNQEIRKMNNFLSDINCDKTIEEKIEYSTYSYEAFLRDEIYNLGYFNDVKIIDKERAYEFGRIDLYGIDDNDKEVCIELKKGNSFNNTKKQLLKYKNSGYFDRVIYCAFEIDNELLKWLKENKIVPYVYRRQLVLSEVC